MAEIIIRSGDELRAFNERTRDLTPALKAIGALLESVSQHAFQEQKLGEYVWEGRYPSQEDPFISLAGALSDFDSGATRPKERRFQRTPVLKDTGNLMGSIASKVSGNDLVEVGSAVEYASLHNFGGFSSQPITKQAKTKIAKWISKKKPRKPKAGAKPKTPKEQSKGEKYALKMMPMLGLDVWETEVVQRPFLGITDQAENDIAETLEIFLTEGRI